MIPHSRHTLDTIWGHTAAKRLVRGLLRKERLPHAMLLFGPDGVGKRSFAFALAKLVLAAGTQVRQERLRAGGGTPASAPLQHQPAPTVAIAPPRSAPDADGDDLFGAIQDDLFGAEPEVDIAPRFIVTPPSEPPRVPAPEPARIINPDLAIVQRIDDLVSKSYPLEFDSDDHVTTLGHADLNIIEPPGKSRSIKVDQIRYLQEIASMPPLEGDRRVILVFGADTITAAGANSLLKWLEEPPPYLVTILCTDQPQRVLETIRSRCAMIGMHPLELQALANHLVDDERLDPAAARVAAAISEGRPGVAARIISAALSRTRQEVLEARLAIDRHGTVAVPFAAHRALAATGSLTDSLLLLLSVARDRMVRTVQPGKDDLLVHRDLAALFDAAPPADTEALWEESERLLDGLRMERHPYVPQAQCVVELALWRP